MASSPSEPTNPNPWEALRLERGWPTPNAMRHIADALDMITPARYGDILRKVADLCDADSPEDPTWAYMDYIQRAHDEAFDLESERKLWEGYNGE